MTVTLHRGIILLPWVGGVPSSAIILALISKSNSKSVVGLSPQEQFDDYYSDVISFFFLINSVCKNCLKEGKKVGESGMVCMKTNNGRYVWITILESNTTLSVGSCSSLVPTWVYYELKNKIMHIL